ncbi:MAG: DUF3592 domain-containing protein [Myxococcota bacterium]|nr:DUF3592 domain-containing protein [Myxococcota bacterium]
MLDPSLEGPGEAPHPPVRDLPAGFRRRLRFLQNPYVLVGFCCGTSGKLVTAGSVLLGGFKGLSWLVGVAGMVGLALMIIGPSLWGIGLRWSEKQIGLLRHGLVASGRITSIGKTDKRGRPYWVEYDYEVGGQRHRGRLMGLDAWVEALGIGRSVHVVYRKKKPHQSTIWPLLGREPARFSLSKLRELRKKAVEP